MGNKVKMSAIDGWREFLASHDERDLRRILHPDVVFTSPVVHTPQRGRDITLRYLRAAVDVLSGPDFRMTGEWHNDTGVVIEFETVIDDILVNGVDMITCDPDGSLITHFKVMIRPLKAIQLIHRLMGEALANHGAS